MTCSQTCQCCEQICLNQLFVRLTVCNDCFSQKNANSNTQKVVHSARRPVSIREGVAVPFQSCGGGMLPEVLVIISCSGWRCTEEKKRHDQVRVYNCGCKLSLKLTIGCGFSPHPSWARTAPPPRLQVWFAPPCAAPFCAFSCVSSFSWRPCWSRRAGFQRMGLLDSEVGCSPSPIPHISPLCLWVQPLLWWWVRSSGELGQSPV